MIRRVSIMYKQSLLILLFCIAGLMRPLAGAAATPDVSTWVDRGYDFASVKKVLLLPVQGSIDNNSSPQFSFELTQEAVEAFKKVFSKQGVVVKTILEVWRDVQLLHGPMSYDITSESVTREDLADFTQKAYEMGFRLFLSFETSITSSTRTTSGGSIPFTTYSNAPITGINGAYIGSVSIPQTQTITIPPMEYTYLNTVCSIHVYDPMSDGMAARSRYFLSRQYQGGDAMSVFRSAFKTSFERLLKDIQGEGAKNTGHKKERPRNK